MDFDKKEISMGGGGGEGGVGREKRKIDTSTWMKGGSTVVPR